MRKCPNCSERNPNDAAVCRFCGQLLPGASKPVTAGPVSSPDTSRVDANSVAGPAALASGVVTALTVLLFFALRGFLPPEADRLLILTVPYFLLWWGVFALLISFLRRKNRSLRSAVGSALAYLLVGVLYIVSAISENWEPSSTRRAPALTARPTAAYVWPEHASDAIRSECMLMVEATKVLMPVETCFRGQLDYSGAIGEGSVGSSQKYITIAQPTRRDGTLFGGIRVPADYYTGTFLPEVRAQFSPGDSFCFYSAFHAVSRDEITVNVGGENVSRTMIFIAAPIRLCPDEMQ